MQEDSAGKIPPKVSPEPAQTDSRTEGICPKCKSATTCRHEETKRGPVWYCVRFDVTIAE